MEKEKLKTLKEKLIKEFRYCHGHKINSYHNGVPSGRFGNIAIENRMLKAILSFMDNLTEEDLEE